MSTCRRRADFFVSPSGRDNDDGSVKHPFATLERACDAVRKLKKKSREDITVMFRGGTYRFERTVVFTREDSGGRGQSISYVAYPGETPVFSGGTIIGGWEKCRRTPRGVPAEAKGKLWVANVPAKIGTFTTLFDSGGILPRAREKGFAPTVAPEDRRDIDLFTLKFPRGALRNSSRVSDIEILVRPGFAWVANMLALESVDEEAGVARTALPATYPMSKVLWVEDSSVSVWVENTYEGLRGPGNWVLDTSKRRLYLWPRKGAPGDDVCAPRLTELVRVEGEIDCDGPRDRPVCGIAFRGITFTHGARFAWEKGRKGRQLQHDWEMFDRPTALLRFRGAGRCAVENCRFADSGGAAIRLDLWCKGNRIAHNTIENIGGTGVLLAGYGPGTKDVNCGNEVIENHIHHAGAILWHSPAIFAWQSGANRIAHNLIHHLPYTAIVVSGRIRLDRDGGGECAKTVRWREMDRVHGQGDHAKLDWAAREPFLHSRKNIVEYNDIHHVVETLGDGNAVYVSGAGGGNVVRGNYLHDSSGVDCDGAIRCDDDQRETLIENNVIARHSGSGIVIKGMNHIVNNVLFDLGHLFRAYISMEVGPVDGSAIRHNIVYAKDPGARLFFQENITKKGAEPRVRLCKADRNIYYNQTDAGWGRRALDEEQAYGVEKHSIAADPMFVDAEHGDFGFRKTSPAPGLGITPIDIGAAGPAKRRRR